MLATAAESLPFLPASQAEPATNAPVFPRFSDLPDDLLLDVAQFLVAVPCDVLALAATCASARIAVLPAAYRVVFVPGLGNLNRLVRSFQQMTFSCSSMGLLGMSPQLLVRKLLAGDRMAGPTDTKNALLLMTWALAACPNCYFLDCSSLICVEPFDEIVTAILAVLGNRRGSIRLPAGCVRVPMSPMGLHSPFLLTITLIDFDLGELHGVYERVDGTAAANQWTMLPRMGLPSWASVKRSWILTKMDAVSFDASFDDLPIGESSHEQRITSRHRDETEWPIKAHVPDLTSIVHLKVVVTIDMPWVLADPPAWTSSTRGLTIESVRKGYLVCLLTGLWARKCRRWYGLRSLSIVHASDVTKTSVLVTMRCLAMSLPHLTSLELGGLANIEASALFPAVNVVVASCPLRRLVLSGFVAAVTASTRSHTRSMVMPKFQAHLHRPVLEELLLDAHPIPFFHLTVAIRADIVARLRLLKVRRLTLVTHTSEDVWFQVLEQCTSPPRTPPPQLIMPRLEALDLTVCEIHPGWLPDAPNLQCLVLITLSSWKTAAMELVLAESFPNLTDLILPGMPSSSSSVRFLLAEWTGARCGLVRPHRLARVLATQRVEMTSGFDVERDPWLLAGDAWGLDARNGRVGHAGEEVGRVTLAWLLKAWKLAVPE
ncbi:hypothetical protein AMAG_16110 [Allomyces macrogynus ATCC 38327]|uniref:Uncharacterized protein n=1 Tax=Allomyces macrogynus (strain ATCC 38327) TaxID=578462 RepID=A0A0L0TAS6_ALLM3|nr:hypothetical protein AMAG_16110 [Allomyces macrogynus ATCC 38327]|eukprot:KNE71805.1 hypothetical protein AMAG_16110 [Allomyces macrogynus ATCC 38327]